MNWRPVCFPPLSQYNVIIIIIITSLFNAWQTAGWYTTASHRYERCWSGASRLPTARSSLQTAYSQHRPCGALVPAEAGPNFAAWWAGVHVCEQLTQGCYAVCLGRGSNSRPSDRESRTLTIEPPRHTTSANVEKLLLSICVNSKNTVLLCLQ